MVGEARIGCCVPFCRRWHHGPADSEWMCWDHWKRIPLVRRRAYFRAVAESAPSWLAPERKVPRWMIPRPQRLISGRGSIRALFRLWDRMKRDAIERAL